jgi:hypothetical protein
MNTMEEEAVKFQNEVIKTTIEALRNTLNNEIQDDLFEKLKRVWEEKLMQRSVPVNQAVAMGYPPHAYD